MERHAGRVLAGGAQVRPHLTGPLTLECHGCSMAAFSSSAGAAACSLQEGGLHAYEARAKASLCALFLAWIWQVLFVADEGPQRGLCSEGEVTNRPTGLYSSPVPCA